MNYQAAINEIKERIDQYNNKQYVNREDDYSECLDCMKDIEIILCEVIESEGK